MLYDVFICHAKEDKDNFVRPLAEALRPRHIEVWYDEFSLRVGDSLREAIDRGLANSQYGIVVLSPAFFRKRWTQRELNGLVAGEMHERRELVLPIWHGVDHTEIIKHSPPLADAYAPAAALMLFSSVIAAMPNFRRFTRGDPALHVAALMIPLVLCPAAFVSASTPVLTSRNLIVLLTSLYLFMAALGGYASSGGRPLPQFARVQSCC